MTVQSTLEYLFDPETLIGALCFALVFFAVAFLLGRLAHMWTRRVMNHQGLLINKTSYKFVGQLLQMAIFLFAATIYAQIIPAFKDLGLTLLVTDNGKEVGTVKEFSFGYTSLVTDDGRTILVPDSLVVTSVLVRVS